MYTYIPLPHFLTNTFLLLYFNFNLAVSYGDTVEEEDEQLGDTTTILPSHDGKRLVSYTDTDLARAGLHSPNHQQQQHTTTNNNTNINLHKHEKILNILEKNKNITGIQNKKQILKRIQKTNAIIEELLPFQESELPSTDQALVLYNSNNINIKYNKKSTFLESIKITKNKPNNTNNNTNNSVITNTTTNTTSNSSIYLDKHEMKFHPHLRLNYCHLHHSNLIFAAIRHNDFSLMLLLCKQIKDSDDIDKENIYGDTVLTLACRLGKLNFIELLIEHFADVNIETSNGRTGNSFFSFYYLLNSFFLFLFYFVY